jgi:hypothetical protein
MNWETMSKEQKQKVAAGALGGVMVLFALWRFVFTPWLVRGTEARTELATLQGQLEAADLAIHTEGLTDEKLADAEALLRKASTEQLPSTDNPLSWVTREIYKHARTVGVDIETVSELGGSSGGNWDTKDMAAYAFRPYSVRVDTQCNYDQVCRLIKTLEENNPYLGVLGISISARGGSPESHQISITLEWPSWKDPAKSPLAPPQEGT